MVETTSNRIENKTGGKKTVHNMSSVFYMRFRFFFLFVLSRLPTLTATTNSTRTYPNRLRSNRTFFVVLFGYVFLVVSKISKVDSNNCIENIKVNESSALTRDNDLNSFRLICLLRTSEGEG